MAVPRLLLNRIPTSAEIVKGDSNWTPKVFKIMAFMAIIMGLALLFYILLGFR